MTSDLRPLTSDVRPPSSVLRPLSSGKASSEPSSVLRPLSSGSLSSETHIALLTAGRDKPYALGIASALASAGISLDFIGSDLVDGPEVHNNPRINVLKFRDQQASAGLVRKVLRILAYYKSLFVYATTARTKILHILWNNKFEFFDRTVLMLYYKLVGKRLVLTIHNVNAAKRDGKDSLLNRLTLKVQYAVADHLFVHTEQMKAEILKEFRVPAQKVSVIPFGINNTLPNTSLTRQQARKELGLGPGDKTLLFFGNIAPYKGLEYLVTALADLAKRDINCRLVIAGRVKGCESYWAEIQQTIKRLGLQAHVIERIEYIPDEKVEVYFKATDAVLLPYTHIFQSGVLFLGYSFGLPVIAADVGSLREDIMEGRTGYVFPPGDSSALALAIETYFASDLYRDLEQRRQDIKNFANEQYSWTKVADITKQVYATLLTK
jgi:glycosyltransferase involved in cell wall biosynthesis